MDRKPKYKRINITMSEDLLAWVDSYAKRRGLSRSATLALGAGELLREWGSFKKGKRRCPRK